MDNLKLHTYTQSSKFTLNNYTLIMCNSQTKVTAFGLICLLDISCNFFGNLCNTYLSIYLDIDIERDRGNGLNMVKLKCFDFFPLIYKLFSSKECGSADKTYI